MRLSVIIPAYNEQERITPTIHDIFQILEELDVTNEVVVVDDGSVDETVHVVSTLAEMYPTLRVFSQPANYGKGAAVKAGALQAHGDLIVFTDADGSTPFREIKKLLEAIGDGADVAIGSRALAQSEVKTHLHRRLLGRVFNCVVNLVAVPNVRDTQCGFKLFTRRAARFLFGHQTAERFGFDVELLYMAQRTGISVTEVPIEWHNVDGSKVNLVGDALQMLLDIFRYRWIHRNLLIDASYGIESDRREPAAVMPPKGNGVRMY